MRPMVVVLIGLFVPAQACAGVAEHGRVPIMAPVIDVGRAADIDAQPPRHADPDILLSPSSARVETAEKSLLPSLDVGPLHATIGGLDGAHLATVDTRDFWNSSISGSVDSRGAKVTFTLPTK